jgi:iron complex transport system permease protein
MKGWPAIAILTVLLAASMVLGLLYGGDEAMSPADAVRAIAAGGPPGSVAELRRAILLEGRLPRVLAGAMVGAGLAISGLLMQGLFRNPLASPGILGATSGGAFAATVATALGAAMAGAAGPRGSLAPDAGTTSILPLAARFAVPLAAIAGTWFAIGIVYLLAARGRRVTITHLILCGVAVNTIFSAGTSLVLTLSIEEHRVGGEIVRWLTGGLTNRSWEHIWLGLPFLLVALVAAPFLARDLNLLAGGEEGAASLGVDLPSLRRRALLVAAMATGSAVSAAGMVGFVGLVAPHILRQVLGPDHRRLVFTAPLFGGAFLVLCDLLAQRVAPPEEIQLGIITSLIGGPFFLYLLLREPE